MGGTIDVVLLISAFLSATMILRTLNWWFNRSVSPDDPTSQNSKRVPYGAFGDESEPATVMAVSRDC